jgi:hypothetical protein
MKSKLVLLSLTMLLLAACEQNPDTDKLDNDYLVYTNYDKESNFGSLNTFYTIDSILLISEQNIPTYWNNASSAKIINQFRENMIDCGYVEVEIPEEADVVLQLSYVSSTYYYYDYVNGNPWWNSYPGYWNWNSYGWYYPFFIPYSFSTGSIIGELVDMKSRLSDTDKLTVVWNAYICGLLNGNSLSMSKTIDAVNQAFSQSEYLSK